MFSRLISAIAARPATTIFLVALATICALAYANMYGGAWVLDDWHAVGGHAAFQVGGNPWTALTSDAYLHRPVVGLSIILNHAISGIHSRGSYRVFNLLIHAANCLLLFGIVRRTLRLPKMATFAWLADYLAAATALFFAAHPLCTNTVTYIIQRAESMMALCYLAALYALIRGAASKVPLRWYAASVVACGVGVGCKQIIVTAPIILLLYDRTFLLGSIRRALLCRWPLYGGLFVTWIGLWSSLGPHLAGGLTGPIPESVTRYQYALTEIAVVAHYLWVAVCPRSLIFDYGWPIARGWGDVWPQALVILPLVALTLLGLWRKTAWGFAGAWVFGILAPTSSFMPTHDPAWEYRMYLPLAGLLAFLVVMASVAAHAAAYILTGLWRVSRERLSGAVAGFIVFFLCVLSTMTYNRNKDFASEYKLWQDCVRKNPYNWRAHSNFGLHLFYAGEYKRAEAAFTAALLLNSYAVEPYNNRGLTRFMMGNADGAFADANEALRRNPEYVEALNNRGNARIAKVAPALAHINQAVALSDIGLWCAPVLPGGTHQIRNQIIEGLTRCYFAGAMLDYNRTIAIDPRHAKAYHNRAVLHAMMGNTQAAQADAATAQKLGMEVPKELSDLIAAKRGEEHG